MNAILSHSPATRRSGHTAPFTRSLLTLLASLSTLALSACNSVEFQSPVVRKDDNKPITSSPSSTSRTELPRAIIPGIAGEPEVRVRLVAASGKASVGCTGGVVWVSTINSGNSTSTGSGGAVGSGGGTAASRPPARMVAPVSIRLNSVSWELTDAAGLVGRFDRSAELRILAQNDTASTSSVLASGTSRTTPSTPIPTLLLDGRRYPGALCFVPRSDVGAWAYDTINLVGVEDYLKGVVASEMLPSWPLNAYQAQAVASRSYALHERQRARLRGSTFDLEATVADQVYKGGEPPLQVARAVNETRGVVLTWNSLVLRSYYHSTSGGRAASAKDTWPVTRGSEFNLAGPLQASPREEIGQTSPWFRWTVTRSRSELSARLRKWGNDMGQPVKAISTVAQIAVAERNNVSRPVRYAVTDTSGRTFALTAEQLRQASNHPASGFANIVRENRVNSGDADWQIVGEVITINGRGLGHGVGMCQWSAKELAERGVDYKTILTRFYPGAKIEKAY